jgi:hypothetical protein
MKDNILRSLLFLLFFVGSLAEINNSTTEFRWTNKSPYVLLLSSYFQSPVTFPTVIAPFSSVHFQLQNNDTRLSDYLNALEYDCHLGFVGDIFDINFGGSSPIPNYQNLTKKIGTVNLFYFSDLELEIIKVGVASDASDKSLADRSFLSTELCYQSENQNSSCTEGDDIVRISGKIDIQLELVINQESADLLSSQDLLVHWQQYDPEERGRFMLNLQQCVFANEEQFNSSLVFDDFDEAYNSVGWTIGQTASDALIEIPLRSYEDAVSYYMKEGYIETTCDEIVSQPSIAIYCLPSNNTAKNGGCQEDLTLNYTHIAVRMSDNTQQWSSKFEKGPLLSHETLSAISNLNCLSSSDFVVGKPVLCFKKPFDITFQIQNKSPFNIAIVNVTLSGGFWKNSKIPDSSLAPFVGNDIYSIQSGQKTQAFLWYRVSLGSSHSSKTLGYLSMYARIMENSNTFSLSPAISSMNVPFDLLSMTYSSQVGDGEWRDGIIDIEGSPVSVNITGEISNNAENLMIQWLEKDPNHRGRALEEISKCLFLDQTIFNVSKVVDDFDDNYNAFGWTVGNTLEGNFQDPLQDEKSAIDFYNSYNYTVVNCTDHEFSVALFCHFDPESGKCQTVYDAIAGNYTYTHAALKLSSNEWTSKFWSGPLLLHADLTSLTGSCSDASSLPVSSLGSVALCFDKLFSSEELQSLSEYPIFQNTSNKNDGGDMFDYSTTVTVLNHMFYDLMRPFSPYKSGSGHTLPIDPVPLTEFFSGIEEIHGVFTPKPKPYIPADTLDTFVLKDPLLWPYGSEGSVGYDIVVGDVKAYLQVRTAFPNTNIYTLKSILPTKYSFPEYVKISFACPFRDPNYASLSRYTILNPCPICQKYKWLDPKKSPVLNLVFADIWFWGKPLGPSGGFRLDFLATQGSPVDVNFEFNLRNDIKLMDLLRLWLQTGFNYGTQEIVAGDIIKPVMGYFNGTWKLGESFQDSVLSCEDTQNEMLCKSIVRDDVDDAYNSVSWSSGFSGKAPVLAPLVNDSQAIDWYRRIGYVVAFCTFDKGELSKAIDIVMFCIQNSTYDCIPQKGNKYTHVAKRLRSSYGFPQGWASKLENGPLIEHRSLEIFPGFGKAYMCFKKPSDIYNEKELPSQDVSHLLNITSNISDFLSNAISTMVSRWHLIYSKVYLNDFMSTDQQFEESEMRENIKVFVHRHPETLSVIIRMMIQMITREEICHYHVILEFITGKNECGETLAGSMAPFDCAKKWLEFSRDHANIFTNSIVI